MDRTLTGKHVHIGRNSEIGVFVTIGIEKPSLAVTIGDNAIIRSHTILYGGNKIGNDFQSGHGVLIRESNTIGNNVSVGSHTVIEHHVTIGDNVRIHSNVFIPEFTVLEDNCWIGPSVVMTNAKYPNSLNTKKNLRGPTIRQNAKIGAHSTLLPGITIGENALIGAGAVVVTDVKKNAVMVGNPAQKINTITNLPYV